MRASALPRATLTARRRVVNARLWDLARGESANLVVRVLQLVLRTLTSGPDRFRVIAHERAGRVGVVPVRKVVSKCSEKYSTVVNGI